MAEAYSIVKTMLDRQIKGLDLENSLLWFLMHDGLEDPKNTTNFVLIDGDHLYSDGNKFRYKILQSGVQPIVYQTDIPRNMMVVKTPVDPY